MSAQAERTNRQGREDIVRAWRSGLAHGEVDPRELICAIHRQVKDPRAAQRLLAEAEWPQGARR